MSKKIIEKDTYLFSNETVFAAHPDKCCDVLSSALLMEYLKGDPYTHAGIEVMGGKGRIFVTGEVTSRTKVNVKKVVRRTLKSLGINKWYWIKNNLGVQSPDINQGVFREDGEIGAGDQGMMFGYACDATEKMLPIAMVILQEFSRCYSDLVKENPQEFYPDGKAQITGVYDKEGNLKKIETFLISYQNSEMHRDKTDEILKSIACDLANKYGIEIEKFLINPTGRFFIGGFEGDAGLTGRKIVVDAYHSFAPVGGGCMNGKDPTKVDMSAAHMARKLAKEYLKSNKGSVHQVEVQLAYAIGVAEPVSIRIKTDRGEEEVPLGWKDRCKPENIIKELDLTNADYVEWAKYGHFTD